MSNIFEAGKRIFEVYNLGELVNAKFDIAMKINKSFPISKKSSDWINPTIGGRLCWTDITDTGIRANIYEDEDSRILIYQSKKQPLIPEIIVKLKQRRDDGLSEISYNFDTQTSKVNEIKCKYIVGLSNKTVYAIFTYNDSERAPFNMTTKTIDSVGKRFCGIKHSKLKHSKRTRSMASMANLARKILDTVNPYKCIFLDK